MTEEAQRIAIAESLGWTHLGTDAQGQLVGIEKPWQSGPRLVPDYLHDLNAMHEVEMTLRAWNGDIGQDQYGRYLGWLENVTRGNIGWKNSTSATMKLIVSATAAQRKDAFLRCIGKWVD